MYVGKLMTLRICANCCCKWKRGA